MRKIWLSSFLAVGFVAAMSNVASAGVDGIVGAGEYDHQWTVQGWNGAVVAAMPTATLYLRQDASNNLYVALVLPLTYVDNSYGGAGFTSQGWATAGKNHNFSDLTSSDQATFLLKKNNGTSFFGGDMDYLNSATNHSGGFTADEGGITTGTAAMVGAAESSMGYNFVNGGNANYLTKSPTLTSNTLGNPIASGSPNWEYEVVYEYEILAGATGSFGNQSVLTGSGANSGLINGFGFELTFVHASPNMYGTNSYGYHIVLTPGVVINPTGGAVPLPASAWMGGLMMLGIVAESVRRRRRSTLLA